MRIIRYFLVVLLLPLALAIGLFVGIYLPPVQDWLTGRAADYVSDLTGMDVRVGRVRLLFPLDLTLDEVVVCTKDSGDTLALVGHLRSRCAVRPLLEGRIEVASVRISDMEIHTGELLPEVVVDARVDELKLAKLLFTPSETMLEAETLGLEGADISIVLVGAQDEADKSGNSFPFVLRIVETSLEQVDVALEWQGRETPLALGWEEFAADSVNISLGQGVYEAQMVAMTGGYVSERGNDAHRQMWQIAFVADSLYFSQTEASAIVRRISAKDESEMYQLYASAEMAMDTLGFRFSEVDIRTPYSYLFVDGKVDRGIFRKEMQGSVSAIVNGKIGGDDLLPLASMAKLRPERERLAGKALDIALEVDREVGGRLACRLSCVMEEILSVQAHAEAEQLLDESRRRVTAEVNVDGQDLASIVQLFAPIQEEEDYLPPSVRGKCSLNLQGTQCKLEAEAQSQRGERISAYGIYNLHNQEYMLESRVDSIHLSDILQSDSLILFSARATMHGREDEIDGLEMSCLSDNHYLDIRANLDVDTLKTKDSVDVRMVMDIRNADMQAMGLSEKRMKAGLHAEFSAGINLQGSMVLKGALTNIIFETEKGDYKPRNLYLDALAQTDSLNVRVNTGDLDLMLASGYGLNEFVRQSQPFINELHHGGMDSLSSLEGFSENPFPRAILSLNIQSDNLLNEYLRHAGDWRLDGAEVNVDTTLPDEAWGRAFCYGCQGGGVKIDTITLSVRQGDAGKFVTTCEAKGLEWDGEDGLTVRGHLTSDMEVQPRLGLSGMEGNVILNNFDMQWPSYALDLHVQDSSIIIVDDGCLKMQKIGVYAHGKNPMMLDGEVFMGNPAQVTADLTLKAERYELVNVRENSNSLLYGKVFVSLSLALRGEITHPDVIGYVKVLENSAATYVLKDSPLSVTDRMEDVVTFVNLTDSVKTDGDAEREAVSPNNLSMRLDIEIESGTSLQVDLGGENYLKTEGGGRLDLQYIPKNGLSLTGRYTLSGGEMKYSLPVVASKDFRIASGSYVEFMGNPQNPLLKIKATERVRASVTEGGTPRYVNFDVVVSLNNSLSDMELAFSLEAPEDISLQNQLAAMTPEERTQAALGMLVAGVYIGGEGASGTGKWSATDALGNFLQKEITSMAGSALKKVDVTISAENNYMDNGAREGTDYAFRFARRFWNNRLSVIVGGRISQSGSQEEKSGNPFIDDISLEWKLGKTGNRLIKIFHLRTHDNILEGEVIETGAGFVFRYTGGEGRKK